MEDNRTGFSKKVAATGNYFLSDVARFLDVMKLVVYEEITKAIEIMDEDKTLKQFTVVDLSGLLKIRIKRTKQRFSGLDGRIVPPSYRVTAEGPKFFMKKILANQKRRDTVAIAQKIMQEELEKAKQQ